MYYKKELVALKRKMQQDFKKFSDTLYEAIHNDGGVDTLNALHENLYESTFCAMDKTIKYLAFKKEFNKRVELRRLARKHKAALIYPHPSKLAAQS